MVATLWAVTAVVVGAVLISRTKQTCNSLCHTTHPRGGAGAVVIILGLLTAVVIASFAALHQEIHVLRLQITHLGDDPDISTESPP